MKQTYSSGAFWEDKVAYSRAVRVGDLIEVAGTTAVDAEGNIIAPGDAGTQARYILSKISFALEQLGGSLKDVIRTRVFVTDITSWEAVGAAHKEAFDGINPAATMLEISSLIDPMLVVEIEATAIVQED